jgi:hypothetical protein
MRIARRTARFFKAILGLIVVGLLISYGVTIVRARRQPATPCEFIPADTVVLALAFLNLGERDGRIVPGRVNELIASRLQECSGRIKRVLTQKAVSDALLNPTRLPNDRPVDQMHVHRRDINVRTVAALRCALDRLDPEPDRIALIAQGEQLERAYRDFRSIYGGQIIKVDPGPVFDNDGGCGSFLGWHGKNGLAWALDWSLIQSHSHGLKPVEAVLALAGAVYDCPVDVKLPTIKWESTDAAADV